MEVGNLKTGLSQPRLDVAAIEQLEQAFIEEMLKYCGPRPISGPFSGGAGEEQFTSFLAQQQAAMLSKAIDLGLGARLGEGKK